MRLPPKQTNFSSREDRAALYVRTMPPAVSGQNGHDRLFSVACRLVHGFGLDIETSLRILETEYNPTCQPPWTEKQLRYKCEQVLKVESHEKPKGHLAGDDEPVFKQPEKKKEAKKEPDQSLVSGQEVLIELMVRIGDRQGEVIFNCGDDLDGFEVGPGKITIVGAPPGAGKTCLASQAGFGALKNHPQLKLVIANAEMEPQVLLQRELSRISQVKYEKIRFATYSEDEEKELFGAATKLRPLLERTKLMTPPYQIERLVESLPDTPGLLIVDYLQKFRSAKETQEGIEAVMGLLRWIAMKGWAVLALSSTARQDGKGNKHDSNKLDMGSFRGSGEIEFQADAAYVLRDQSNGAAGDKPMVLDCVKNRHGMPRPLDLTFIASEMRFVSTTLQKHDFGAYGEDEFS